MTVIEMIELLQKFEPTAVIRFSIADDESEDPGERWFVEDGVHDCFGDATEVTVWLDGRITQIDFRRGTTVCDCESNRPQFYDANFVKGRKAHVCCECLRTIETGETQEVVTGKWDGGFDSFRTCMMCVDMRNELDLDCWVHGCLIDEVSSGDHDRLESVQAFKKRRNQNYSSKACNLLR